VSVQADLFGADPLPARTPSRDGVGWWGRERPVEAVEPYPFVPWGAYVITRDRSDQQLARFLARSHTYRAYRCVLCRRSVVVDLGQWAAPAEQVAQCPYAACSGWVQRDSERIEPERAVGSEGDSDHAGGVARDPRAAGDQGGVSSGRYGGVADGAVGGGAAAAQDPQEPPPDDYFD
jgi:hypothetical protein